MRIGEKCRLWQKDDSATPDHPSAYQDEQNELEKPPL
jgi:hypothetical protein